MAYSKSNYFSLMVVNFFSFEGERATDGAGGERRGLHRGADSHAEGRYGRVVID